MNKIFALIFLLLIIVLSFFLFIQKPQEEKVEKELGSSLSDSSTKGDLLQSLSKKVSTLSNEEESKKTEKEQIIFLKDVGEPYMDYFGLSDKDFELIKNAGFNVIESNFDICATNEDVLFFLDKAKKYGLKVVMPAGSGEAEWGYECDSIPSSNQKPQWQKEKVQNWIKKWMNNENIYAWDISNEAGGVFPNSDKGYYLTGEQLQKAYVDVKNIDPNRPIIIRMNGWYFYDFDDNFFREGNPFGKDIADIVMINAYSNVSEYFRDFVSTVGKRATTSIKKINPSAKTIIALGAWEEPPLWVYPDLEHLKNDYNLSSQVDSIGVAFFKYGASGSEWYLPNEKELWQKIQELVN